MEERKTKRIVFWQNMPSHHQAEYIVELATTHGYDVTWAVEQSVEGTIRAEMGWPEFEAAGVNLVVQPDDSTIRQLIEESPENSLHLFSGVYFNRHVRRAFLRARRTNARLALMAESPVPAGLLLDTETKSLGARLRFLVPVIHRGFKAAFGKQIQRVFCIGKLSREWYTNLGYTKNQIVSWAYFPPAPKQIPNFKQNKTVTFIYMGFLANHKGIDTAVSALSNVTGDWKLICIGEGPLEQTLKSTVAKSGVTEKCEFMGFQKWERAMAMLEKADYALVPSRYDGWGAVVSEALMRGVRVLVSDHAGACDLVREAWRGSMLPAGDDHAWQSAIQQAIDSGPLDEQDRRKVFDWATCITGASGAAYFDQIVRAMDHRSEPPTAPWFE